MATVTAGAALVLAAALASAACTDDAPVAPADSSAPADAAMILDPVDLVDPVDPVDPVDLGAPACPAEMVRIAIPDGGDAGFCVDRWEAHVVEVLADGGVRAHSPYDVVDGITVAARAEPHVVPQGYISQVQASAACALAGKRLCSATEFRLACSGPDPKNYYPYGGEARIPGNCNEGKGSSVARFFGNDPSKWTYAEFNDPRLNQWDGGLAPTASYPKCVSPGGVFDCVGNLHEWGDDAADAKGHGRFRGGFYGDAEVNGHGCLYVTSAHELAYHDYSTGFRCCSDAE